TITNQMVAITRIKTKRTNSRMLTIKTIKTIRMQIKTNKLKEVYNNLQMHEMNNSNQMLKINTTKQPTEKPKTKKTMMHNLTRCSMVTKSDSSTSRIF